MDFYAPQRILSPVHGSPREGLFVPITGMCFHTLRTLEVFPKYGNNSPSYHQRMRAAHIHAGFYVGEIKKKMGNYIPLILPGKTKSKSSSQGDPAADTSWNSKSVILFILDCWWLKESPCPVKILSNYRGVLFQLVFISIKISKINLQACSDKKFFQFASQLWWSFPKSGFPCGLE